MDAVDQFATEAARFCSWARQGDRSGPGAAREALQHIVRLYAAGLALPPEWSAECREGPEADRVPEHEWWAVFAACSGLPFDIYWELFDPMDDAGKPVAGSLADDIADIYSDVARGLIEYESGRRAEAHWEWSFHLRHHWGAHATSSIRALHWWCGAQGSSLGP